MKNFFSTLKTSLSILGLAVMLSSCSVAMAAKKEGTSIEKVQKFRTRGDFLSAGGVIINSEVLLSGELVETYQFQKEKGSTARAVMHGLLDISTFGLWEFAGTPIEGSMAKKSYICLKVYYDHHGVAKKIELV